MDKMNFLIVIMGLATVILSIWAAVVFFRASSISRNQRKLSTALAWQLIGEAIIGGGTLLFAVAAYYGFLQNLGGDIQSTIRLSMFAATSGTTLHLIRTLRGML